MTTSTIDVRRSADRFPTEFGGCTRSSFSFGHHYDPPTRTTVCSS
jgi:hypothetical protein